jgi:hypothetical protein
MYSRSPVGYEDGVDPEPTASGHQRDHRPPVPPAPPPATQRHPSEQAFAASGTAALISLVIALNIGGVVFVVPAILGVIALVSFSVMVVRGFRGDPDDVRVARPSPAEAPPVRRPEPVDDWAAAQQRFHRLRSEYAAYECDPLQVLRLPALSDAAVASTARFVDAFAEAQGLHTDRHPGPAHSARFVVAVDLAESTWQAAQDAAERIRLSGLTPAERATVERIIKLLTTARDSDSEPERLVAYSLAHSELTKLDRAGVVRVPRIAMAALDERARRALPR